jgi:hypothetical protein
MSISTTTQIQSQNDLLFNNLKQFYENFDNLTILKSVINNETVYSLRIVDWFVTNYAKEHYTVYQIEKENCIPRRFKVYYDYKQNLKAYSKKRFDPFCRDKRIMIPYNNSSQLETTIGQLNFFKWAIENKIIDYIEENYKTIKADMDMRTNATKRTISNENNTQEKTRKKREELSISACKSIKKENVKIVVNFN